MRRAFLDQAALDGASWPRDEIDGVFKADADMPARQIGLGRRR